MLPESTLHFKVDQGKAPAKWNRSGTALPAAINGQTALPANPQASGARTPEAAFLFPHMTRSLSSSHKSSSIAFTSSGTFGLSSNLNLPSKRLHASGSSTLGK